MDRIVNGIVMEVSTGSVVVMTRDGEFLKVKKPSSGISPGNEITAAVLPEAHAERHRFHKIRYASIAAAILILLIPILYLKQAYATVAYVNVDINPSIEMGINKYNKVNDVYGLNEDGKKLLQKVDINGADIHDALDSIINAARESGYISEDGENHIEVALVAIDKESVNITEDTLVDYVSSAVRDTRVDAKIKVQGADKKTHDDAAKENMSTNKYLDKNQDGRESINVDVKKQPDTKENGSNLIENGNSGNGNNTGMDDKSKKSTDDDKEKSSNGSKDDNGKDKGNGSGNGSNVNNNDNSSNSNADQNNGQNHVQNDKPQSTGNDQNNRKGKK